MKNVKSLFVVYSLFCAVQANADIASGLYTYTSRPGHPSCGMEVQVSADRKHLVTKNVTNPETGMACDSLNGYGNNYTLIGPDAYSTTGSTLYYHGGGQFSIHIAGGTELDLTYFGPGPAPKPRLFRGSGSTPSATSGSVEYYCKLAYRAAIYSAQEQCQSYYGPSRCQAGKVENLEYDKFSTEGFVSCSAYLFLNLKK